MPTPPLDLTPRLVDLVSRISETLGRWEVSRGAGISPRLRRANRIRTIQASLAIEQNSLTVEQVTAILDGKPVMGPPREIREVQNAIAAYEALAGWNPSSEADFLKAHDLLLSGLAGDAGRYRAGGVGIYREAHLVHMAPPADRVPFLVADLLAWVGTTDLHPLLAGAVAHYEIEFIHPFSDGNGRMGRLWQSLILSRWREPLAWLPMETVIRNRQEEYYAVLAVADQAGNAAPFAEFILTAILETLQTGQVDVQVSDQVADLLSVLPPETELDAAELMRRLGLKHRGNFRKRFLGPALEAGMVQRTDPDSPNSPRQRYRRS